MTSKKIFISALKITMSSPIRHPSILHNWDFNTSSPPLQNIHDSIVSKSDITSLQFRLSQTEGLLHDILQRLECLEKQRDNITLEYNGPSIDNVLAKCTLTLSDEQRKVGLPHDVSVSLFELGNEVCLISL
jgi:hypothetical protein